MYTMDERPAATGRFLVTIDDTDKDVAGAISALGEASGMRVASASDFVTAAAAEAFDEQADALYLDELGVAVVSPSEEREVRLQRALSTQRKILFVEPEVIMFAIGGDEPLTAGYIKGYRDGVSGFADAMLSESIAEAGISNAPARFFDSEVATWGIQAVAANESRFTGAGIKVAVLDTGIDLNHPDFAGRTIVSESFIRGESVQDGHGHGTHCAGTACGPVESNHHPRYGVAHCADLFVGKVLGNSGSGSSGGVVEGIRWALSQGCEIISMSLGAPTMIGQRISAAYERAAQRALSRGSLIIAAAGNESDRPFHIAPLGSPGNCPSIFTVAAVDARLQIAPFSCGRMDPDAGRLEIAAPGVRVFSSFTMPQRYRRLSGTSMATPHVAGVAALYAQADPSLRGAALWRRLLQTARSLPLPERDVGNGLVQAP